MPDKNQKNGDVELYHHEGENLPKHSHHDAEVIDESRVHAYWRANLALLFKLLTVWFVVSYGFAILLREWLNQFNFFGFKLGFWFAQQGAIYVFVALIFIYAWRMKKIDADYGVDDKDEAQ